MLLRRTDPKLPEWSPTSKYYDHKKSRKYSKRRKLPGRRLVLAGICLIFLLIYSLLPYREPDFHAKFDKLPTELNIEFYDLADATATPYGWTESAKERVLFCIPLREASDHLPLLFTHLRNISYPHSLIDLSFLVSDSEDDTLALLTSLLTEIQEHPSPELRFNRADIYEKDFGQFVSQGFSDRHGFAAQGPRRKLMGRARNWLLASALRPEHSWVYWRDADIESAPSTILEDLMMHNSDVIVPNVWRPLPEWIGGEQREQPYDLNAWQESDAGLELAKSLSEDVVIVEGYAEYATWRPHLAYARNAEGDLHDEVDLDGVGGVSLLVKASVFRAGANFPGFAFMNHAETEGFGKMAKRMGYRVIGLPNYVVWHVFEPSVDDMSKLPKKHGSKRKPLTKKERAEKEAEKKALEDEEFQIPQVPQADESAEESTD
ncbi:Anp1-domain-containing protein [Myxozyma melibiosi]|uniref:Anp1-domain-containing protein n=1 Tax=Myxozyma melibiosi TaxID=54550 RepID=A0ABR1F202_9ASCO